MKISEKLLILISITILTVLSWLYIRAMEGGLGDTFDKWNSTTDNFLLGIVVWVWIMISILFYIFAYIGPFMMAIPIVMLITEDESGYTNFVVFFIGVCFLITFKNVSVWNYSSHTETSSHIGTTAISNDDYNDDYDYDDYDYDDYSDDYSDNYSYDTDYDEYSDDYYSDDYNDDNIHHVDPHWVDGYTRNDGTEVDGYWRGGDDGYWQSNPDGYDYNNLN